MRYYQFLYRGRVNVGVETTDDTLVNLTAINPQITSTLDLLKAGSILGADIDTVARKLIDIGLTTPMSVSDLLDPTDPERQDVKLLPPINSPEVWAFGVTYMDSMRERQLESGTPDVYAKIYEAERPEAFFKATWERVQAPFDEVGIRADSGWDVPEPELAFVVFQGRIIGYTVGNDMSSRTIEGENPLYLPQAKVYEKSAALGPCLATPETVGNPQDLDVTLTIKRGGQEAFKGSTNTSNMKRDCQYLANWLQKSNPVPDGTAAMTGTGVIPPQTFTLDDDDVIEIEIEKIGKLVNTVVTV